MLDDNDLFCRMAVLSGGKLPPSKFLFEAYPEIMPYDHLTELESMLWLEFQERFNEMNKK